MDRIPVAGPWITAEEIAAVTDAVTHGWYGNANVYQQRFETRFATYLGVGHAISLPSCTSAIHLALAALDVGPGDEVIVPDVTWIASAAPVSYVGATPVFADIDPQTWCLSVAAFEDCISPQTKAVIPVDLYGSMPAYDALQASAQRHGIAIIEDAAEAFGSEYRGRRAGSWGDAGTFSFHGSKTLTTGEGGMLVTNRDEIAKRVLVLRDHGRQPGDTNFCNSEVGFKYRMSSMQAALGLAQLERGDDLIAKKRTIFAWYRDELADVLGLTVNAEPPGSKNAYWMVTVVWDQSYGLTKTDVKDRLAEFGIDTRPFFHPLSSLPAYQALEQAQLARQRNRVAYDISPRALNLPSALCLTHEHVRHVCNCLRTILATRSRFSRASGPEL